MGYAFNVLNLLYELMRDQQCFVTTQPPSDIADRLPALIISSDAPVKVANFERPGAGAVVQAVFTAVAETDEVAFGLADSAYSAMWDKRHVLTRWGWVPSIREVQAPALVVSEQTADNLYQYQFVLDLVIRK